MTLLVQHEAILRPVLSLLRAARGIGHVIGEALPIQLSEKRGTSPLLMDIGNLPCLPPVSLARQISSWPDSFCR
jgi:hypothetical protein